MKWLDKYEDGKQLPKAQKGKDVPAYDYVNYGTPEYKEAYEQGRFAHAPNPLSEVVVTPYDKEYPFYQSLSPEERKYINDPSPIGRQIRARATDGEGFNAEKAEQFAMGWMRDLPMAALQAPQSVMVEGIEGIRGNEFNLLDGIDPGKQRVPSETWGVENPYAAFAVDAITDPALVTGIGAVAKRPLQKGLNSDGMFGKLFDLQNGPLSNTHKLNPWAFKSKPASNFNSEINWGQWNKEIPNNPQLMKEYNAIEQTSKANGSWMKNSDGSTFNGTPEQFVQQNSENFKKAFGNTKVRDKKGNIQITNHSTFENFDNFDMSKFGKTDDGFYGKGVYFHPNTNTPKLYGDIDMNSYINIESPMPHENYFFFGREGKGAYWDSVKNEQVQLDDVSSLWKNKHDGYITNHGEYPINDYNSTEYITNIPSNIKSATGNNGMFDMTNPNIYKSVVPGAIGLGVLQQGNQEETPQYKQGGVIKDDRGQWAHPGEITEINSPNITMRGVNYPVLGVSKQTGEKKMMLPEKNYKFANTKQVVEYPMVGNWLDKFQ